MFILEQFCESLAEGDRKIVQEAIKMETLTHVTKLHLAGILGQYGLGVLPSKDKLENMLESLARYTVLVKPFRYLYNMRHPIADMAFQIFGHITELEFRAMLQRMVPTGMQVVANLHINYSRDEDGTLKALEERLPDYLQTFLVSLGKDQLTTFIRFVSGCEILPERILVEFNSEMAEELMIPTAHTCSVSLHLSRYFLTYQSFSSVMQNLLTNPELWARFDLI